MVGALRADVILAFRKQAPEFLASAQTPCQQPFRTFTDQRSPMIEGYHRGDKRPGKNSCSCFLIDVEAPAFGFVRPGRIPPDFSNCRIRGPKVNAENPKWLGIGRYLAPRGVDEGKSAHMRRNHRFHDIGSIRVIGLEESSVSPHQRQKRDFELPPRFTCGGRRIRLATAGGRSDQRKNLKYLWGRTLVDRVALRGCRAI